MIIIKQFQIPNSKQGLMHEIFTKQLKAPLDSPIHTISIFTILNCTLEKPLSLLKHAVNDFFSPEEGNQLRLAVAL